MERTFWLVWNPRGGSPTVRHSTEDSALSEAKRLAERCPGDEFFILKAVRVAKRLEPIQVVDLVETVEAAPSYYADDRPF